MNAIAVMATLEQIQPLPVVGSLPIAAACRALGLSRATWYRYQSGQTQKGGQAKNHQIATPTQKIAPSEVKLEQVAPVGARALSPVEKQAVREVLYSERFVDHAPAEVYPLYWMKGSTSARFARCIVSLKRNPHRGSAVVRQGIQPMRVPSFWQRVLMSCGLGTSRSCAERSKQATFTCILDVFSRYVVGWMVAPRESAALAEQLIAESAFKQGISTGQLTLHADRGSSMRSKPVTLLLEDLGITRTHSRPHVSNDNPFSESAFKTLKYPPSFPARFASLEQARAFCVEFSGWYNQEHHHGGLALLTPSMVHHGQAACVIAARNATLAVAFALHPERFTRGLPVHARVPDAVWINAPISTPVMGSDLAGAVGKDCRESLEAKRV